MRTPEGYLKADIKKFITSLPCRYQFWPVQMGIGKRTVDGLWCINGRFVACEVKREGEKPTPLQEQCMKEVIEAGGAAFWCDTFESFIANMKMWGLIPQFDGDKVDQKYVSRKK